MPHLQDELPRLLTVYRQTPVTLRDLLSEYRGEGGLWLARDPHRLVGVLRMDSRRTWWKLTSFVMDPAVRGRGQGETLLRVATAAADGPVRLQVQQDNPAQFLQLRNGFEADCVSDGRILMTQELK